MRVAVYLPAGHPEHGGEDDGPAVFAYRLGRIEDGVHNAPVGHAAVDLESYVNGLVDQAKAEYPDATVRVERLVDNGDGTGEWIDEDEFDPERHTPVGAGAQKQTDLHVTGGQVH